MQCVRISIRNLIFYTSCYLPKDAGNKVFALCNYVSRAVSRNLAFIVDNKHSRDERFHEKILLFGIILLLQLFQNRRKEEEQRRLRHLRFEKYSVTFNFPSISSTIQEYHNIHTAPDFSQIKQAINRYSK